MHSHIDNVKKKIEELEVLANIIEKRGVELLEQAPIEENKDPYPSDYDEPEPYCWGIASAEVRKLQYEIVVQYQQWYSVAKQIIADYMPERHAEFARCYSLQAGHYDMGIINFLRFSTAPWESKYLIRRFTNDFMLQRSILLSLPDVIEIKQLGLRRAITADLARTEMDQAELLFEGGFHRAAGSIAGIALELHLKTVCDIDSITYREKATMNDFIQALRGRGKLDITEVKHLEYLASIRNQCSHPKDVSERDIRILLVGVRKLI